MRDEGTRAATRVKRPGTRAPAVVVLCTAGSRTEAERLATALVGERLAACVSLILPLRSVYRWRGRIERAREVLLVIKTRRALAARLITRVRALHSYEIPEVIALPIVAGSAPYLAWLTTETTQRRAALKSAAATRARRRRR